jgi:hypothetical protein
VTSWWRHDCIVCWSSIVGCLTGWCCIVYWSSIVYIGVVSCGGVRCAGAECDSSPFDARVDDSVIVRPRDAGASDEVSFAFDKVFGRDVQQEDVFKSVMEDSVDAVLRGYVTRVRYTEPCCMQADAQQSNDLQVPADSTRPCLRMVNPEQARRTPCSATTPETPASSRGQ